ncbi:MAG: DegT/DnrJ/EryC1/StrS family aminotransferase [Candidatus Marinimicrobia bacterium]|nr:DegT/DnrJ/EryC1/StrS family aminotransferase [bacterium]MCG2716004.1 DegT/DnrJ/EryC1/StrS family aminotransferase [Candidatus Neomarinimicrobiota bacterium]
MSLTKMPTAGTPFIISDMFQAKIGLFQSDRVFSKFGDIFKEYLKVENLLFINSGTAANYIIYKVLKQIRKRVDQVEIILPAYTAPSLLLPIEAEGLTPVLVDIDSSTFNLDTTKVTEKFNSKTLAVMPVHMFGLPCEVESLLKLTNGSDIFILEDGASALGTTVNKQHIGTTAPFGFYSLNRGKNISTLAGGIIVWKNDDYSELFQQYVNELTTLSTLAQFIMFLKFIGLSLAVRPFTYTLMSPIVSKFKYTTLHSHFDSFKYTTMQAALGVNLWKRIDFLTNQRVENGLSLSGIFQNSPGYRIATIPVGANVAFNQFPVIVENLETRKLLINRLLDAGIETSTLYDHPLHHIFPELNESGNDPYPNATYLAEHLLLFPPHAQIGSRILLKIQEVIDIVG